MTEASPSRPRLPVQQLAILVVVRLAEPLAYTSIYPYLPEMIRGFGVRQNEVAKWAGLTTAVFAISQGLAAVPWGRASDRYGRKPVILCGLASTMVCFVAWGMSTSLPMAMAARAVQGAGNGNVAIIRTVVAEIVPVKELQPRAFSIMPLVWSVGSVIGPAFGGFLAQPAVKYPHLFGHIHFFQRFPYALPNLVATLFFLVSAAAAILFLQESLPSKRDEPDAGLELGKRISRLFRRTRSPPSGRRPFADGEAALPSRLAEAQSKKARSPEPPPRVKEILTRQTSISLLTYTILCLHSVAFDQNITVFLNYPVVEHTPDNTKLPFYFTGGFGLESNRIGTLFAVYGITCGLIQFIIYPSLVRKYGILKCWNFCAVAMPFIYFITPYSSLFASEAARTAAIVVVLMIKGLVSVIAFPCITILFTNSCRTTRVLGTVNGLGTAFSGFARAIGPASTGLAFTWGANHGYIVSAYYFLALVAAVGAIPGFWIEEGDSPAAADADAAAPDDNHPARDPAADHDEPDARTPLLAKPGVSCGTVDSRPG